MIHLWVALNKLAFTPKINSSLIERFKTPECIFSASIKDLKDAGFQQTVIEKIKNADIEGAKKEVERLKDEGIKILTIFDKDYPYLLKNIHTPPILLYIKGDERLLNKKSIAIVGSRRAKGWAKSFAYTLAKRLALAGAVVVSGLAKGIDTSAHVGALEDGKTIAVLGCGLDYCYPASNRALFKKIAENGALITEFPLGTRPFGKNFPQRNRIISGISEAVVIVQAPLRSGALITANCALEQGREVFCVPSSPTDPMGEGSNLLIKEGAIPITTADELIEHLGLKKEERREKKPLGDEAIVYNALSNEALCAEELIWRTNLDAKRLNVALTKLQLQGLIAKRGQVYKRI